MAQKINRPNKIIIHCTATLDKYDVGFNEIDKLHKDRGFKVDINGKIMHCGYHKIFRRSGKVDNGRPYSVIGAHAKGYNTNSIGWAWSGIDKMTPEQVDAIVDEYVQCYKLYSIPPDKVFGHYEFNKYKTCPNIDMSLFRKMLSLVFV